MGNSFGQIPFRITQSPFFGILLVTVVYTVYFYGAKNVKGLGLNR